VSWGNKWEVKKAIPVSPAFGKDADLLLLTPKPSDQVPFLFNGGNIRGLPNRDKGLKKKKIHVYQQTMTAKDKPEKFQG